MPPLGPDDEHDATGFGPVVMIGQVRVVQLFPEVAACGVQEATGVLTLFGVHVVEVQLLLELAAAAVQVCTGTFEVVTGAGQVTWVQLLALLAAAAVQAPPARSSWCC